MPDGEVKVPQEQIDALVAAVERVERRRKIMLYGYLLALLALVGGQLTAFIVVARAPRGTFMGWVYLVPFTLVGLIFWLFGWLARKKHPSPISDRSKPPART